VVRSYDRNWASPSVAMKTLSLSAPCPTVAQSSLHLVTGLGLEPHHGRWRRRWHEPTHKLFRSRLAGDVAACFDLAKQNSGRNPIRCRRLHAIKDVGLERSFSPRFGAGLRTVSARRSNPTECALSHILDAE
jgi:hypothetical protein